MFIKPLISSVFIMSLLSVFGLNLAGASSSGYYSVPAADFNDVYGNCMTFNYGSDLWPYSGYGCDVVAGIHLPDGVTVTKIMMYWYDDDETANIQASISRTTYPGMSEQLSSLISNYYGDGSSSSYAVTSIPIDNSNYEYYIRVSLPSDRLGLIGFRIEYTNQTFLSLINK